METRASYVLVGAFVLGLVAAAVFFVLWLGRGEGGKDLVTYRVHFTGNVTGLVPGAAVRYRGITKGEVRNVDVWKEHDDIIEVQIRVARDTPIYTDTVASLEVQGLTGTPFVQLKRSPKPGVEGKKVDPKDADTVVIEGESSGLERIFEEFPKAIASVTQLADRASALLDKENQENFKNMLRGASEALAAIRGFAAEGQTIVRDARAPINELGNLARRGQASLGELEKAAQSFSGLMADGRTILRENRRPIADFAATGLYEFSLFLTDMRKFVRTFDRILTRVESDPSQFLFGNRQRGFETQGGQR
ncbi:MAG TPA: MlaD family protein [Alphaproteobacteria bacterium]|jgi:phospholipid/cholesterol/gamma-HCH transport system substrate-binding protein